MDGDLTIFTSLSIEENSSTNFDDIFTSGDFLMFIGRPNSLRAQFYLSCF